MKYFTLAIHYPIPEHTDDLLNAMHQLSEAAQNIKGLIDMSAWVDDDSGRVFATSTWDSAGHAQAAWQELGAIAAKTPFSQWERQPREVFMKLRQGA
jgi:heme-degrading monooxygenase HmoA